jgi:hypothetical protein
MRNYNENKFGKRFPKMFCAKKKNWGVRKETIVFYSCAVGFGLGSIYSTVDFGHFSFMLLSNFGYFFLNRILVTHHVFI